MRQFILTLLMVSGAFAAEAQTCAGIRTSLYWAGMTFNEPSLDPGSRLAPGFACFLDIPLSERVSIVPELAYTSRGYQDEFAALGTMAEQRLLLDYADLYFLAKVHFGQEPAQPHLILGLCGGRMVGARVLEADKNGSFMNADGTVLAPEQVGMDQWNAGLTGGAGFTFTLKNSWIFIDGRYNYGLTNIWNGVVLVDVNGQQIRELNCYDRSISVNIGWMLPTTASKASDENITP